MPTLTFRAWVTCALTKKKIISKTTIYPAGTEVARRSSVRWHDQIKPLLHKLLCSLYSKRMQTINDGILDQIKHIYIYSKLRIETPPEHNSLNTVNLDIRKGQGLAIYRKLPLISPELIQVRKGFWVGLIINGGAYIRMGL